MKRTLCAVGLGALCLTWAAPTHAAVLCQKRSGAVFVRNKCKKKETVLNLAQFGAVGPKGDKGDPGVGPLTSCPPDSVLVGTTCVDKYEASVWQIPPSNTAAVQKVQAGTVTFADLTGGGAVHLAPAGTCSGPTDYGTNFPDTGNWTPVPGSSPPSPGVYAVSVAGVLPSACITWFHANQACALSSKRLVTNGEWQRAAAGTPDPGAADDGSTTCVTNSGGPANTGSRTSCKSSWGAFDMVGNVTEWVADWGDLADMCTNWPASFGSDLSCVGGPGSSFSNLPGALRRGGNWLNSTGTGVFAVLADFDPSHSVFSVGFRCAR